MQTSKQVIRRLYGTMMLGLLLVTLLTLASNVHLARGIGDWWDTDWRYRKTITIDHTKVAGDLTNFPVLISLTDSDLALKARSDGYDIAFTDSSFVKLDHEIEFYDSTAGSLIAWVRANLSSTTDAVLQMYYGNPTASNQQNPTGVWDPDFVMVQHLAETGSPSSIPSDWYKYEGNPTLNGTRNGFASVFYDNSSGIYHLFCSWGSILHFTSSNGKTGWTADPLNPMLTGNNEGVPMVWKENDTWYMLYRYGGPDKIGLANSTDASHWTRYEGNPVINVGSFCDPWGIIKVDSTYYLWYNDGWGGGQGRCAGLATSTDLKTWTQDPGNPIFTGGRFCTFPFKYESYYYMLVPRYTNSPYGEIELYRDSNPTFYSGSREYLGVVINPGSAGAWDDHRFDTPCVLTDTIYRDTYEASNNELWTYYAGTGTLTGSGADWWTGMCIEQNITDALTRFTPPTPTVITDSTTNHNNGQPNGGMNMNVSGKIDGADEFDGTNDYVDCGDSSSLKGMTALTVEAWVNPKTIRESGIVAKWSSWTAGTGGSYILWQSSTGHVGWGVITETSTAYFFDTPVLNPDEWYHLVGTFDGSQINLYINGTRAGTPKSITGNITSTSDPCYIGRYTTPYMNGTIDEVRISNVSRSASWITTEYNNQANLSTFYTVGSEETIVRDVALSNVESHKTVVAQGCFCNLTITVENQGALDETFNVTVCANTTEIGKVEVTLTIGDTITVKFAWNTSGFGRAQNISAYAGPVPWETELSDNTFIVGVVKVTCLGDINGDYVTDAKDFQLVKRDIPSMPGSPKWNPNADVNDDLVIDSKDYQIVKRHIPSIFP